VPLTRSPAIKERPIARHVARATEPPWPEAGVSADTGNGRFSNPIPAVKRKRQPHTSVAGGRADEDSASNFIGLDYR
jgi:hypothetical protein